MKTELYTNCALVRVPIVAGTDEYYLPQNVEWANKKIDKMVICAPSMTCVDPIDGQTPVLGFSDIADCFINLYDSNNRELMHDVSFEQILHRNNNVLRVDASLNLSLCRIYFTTPPAADATLLLYVFYGTRTEEYYELPKKSITAVVPLTPNQEMTFQEIINTYVHALANKIKGIYVWDAENNPAWVTLRDYDYTYQMANVHTELMRPDMNGGTAENSQARGFFLNDLDIDFDYSHIREAAGQYAYVKMTFLFD